jgi:carbonic anhydrase/acetyltransferase-like protein (isoleucine patch superfamily)
MEPKVHESCYVHPSAVIVGAVTIHENCGIWPHAVIRGDEAPIEIGPESNVQDCCVIHVNEFFPVKIGRNVSLGHGSVVHGATIGDYVIVGLNAGLLNGAKIGDGSIIGANTVVKEGMVVPPGSVVVGAPGKIIREGDDKLMDDITLNAEHYKQRAKEYLAGKYREYRP